MQAQQQAIKLVVWRLLRCNGSFLFFEGASHPMRVKRLQLQDFEKRSVAMFSAVLVGVALAGAARAQSPAVQPSAQPPATATQQPKLRLTTAQVQQAFQHIDSNQDGKLSRAEVSVFPRIDKHFERIDVNRDGQVSPAEFGEALQHAS